jgi:hypothetical protein
MGQQILLFKIELCPEIKSVYQHHFISRPFLQLSVEHHFEPPPPQDAADPKFRNECRFETSKSDGFADDNTTGTLCEFESLSKLKIVLEDFSTFSGLHCNTEKTVIMQVGRKVPLTDEIKNLSFEFADKIHILGMDIDSELTKLDDNFEKTIGGIKKALIFGEGFI